MRALLVHNCNAGTEPCPREPLEQALREQGIAPDYLLHGEEDLSSALNHGRSPFDLVVAAGGDGTVADVVSVLEDRAIPIAIIPLGGSNNIARSLGADGDWRALVRGWRIDRWRLLNRCEAVGPWGYRTFVEAAGCGALTKAAAMADDEPGSPEEKRRNGRAALARAIEGATPFDCAIETERWSWDGACLMAEVMNIPLIGSRLPFAPTAGTGDGLFDIVIATPDDRHQLAGWVRCPDAAPCPLARRRARRARLTVSDRPVRLDDRSPDDALAGVTDIRMRDGLVKILIPERMI